VKWRLGSCPACGGDLFEDRENDSYYTCLLCTRSYPAKREAGADPTLQRVLENLPANLAALVKSRSRRARPAMLPALARPVRLKPVPGRIAPSGPRAA
jgi:hypothetical protein